VAALRRWADVTTPFAQVRDTFLFLGVGVAVLGGLAGAVDILAMVSSDNLAVAELPSAWLDRTVSHGAGILAIAPLLMMTRQYAHDLPSLRGRWLEFVGCIAVSLLALAYLMFGAASFAASDAGVIFLVMLPLLWGAVRIPLGYAYSMMVGVMAVSIAGTLAGHGPFSGPDIGRMPLTFAEMMLGFGSAILVLGAALHERRAAEEALHEANAALESRVESRTRELLKSRRRLEQMAYFDELTGLPNRRMFDDRFGRVAALAKRRDEGFAMLLVDLDHFKEVNDKLGHDAGDALLQEAARRLTASVREIDSVARIGGDEFAILLAEAKTEVAVEQICRRIVEGFVEPVVLPDKTTIKTSPSIGAAMYPRHGISQRDLYKAADIALYAAKDGGRNTWRWYEPKHTAGMSA